MHSFPEALRQARLARRFSQSQMARELGVSRLSISQWETGRSVPKGHNLVALARVIGVPLERLTFPTKRVNPSLLAEIDLLQARLNQIRQIALGQVPA